MTEISNRTGIKGRSTMQAVIDELYDKHGKINIKNSIEIIRSFKKAKLSLEDAIAGARTKAVLDKLGVDGDSIPSFVSDIYKQSLKQELEPSKLVEFTKVLFDIQLRSDIPIDEIASHMKKISKQKEDLEKEITSLEQRIKDAKARLETELRRYDMTTKELEQYRVVKNSLEQFGAKISDMYKIEKVIDQISQLNYDPRELVKQASSEKKIAARIEELEEQEKGIQSQMASSKQELGELLDKIENIENKLKFLEVKHLNISQAIASVEKIKESGLDPLYIVQWEKILEFAKISPHQFEEKISNYGSLKVLISKLKEEKSNLEKEKTSLEASISSLTGQKTAVEASLSMAKKMTVDILEASQSKAIDTISNLEESARKSIQSTTEESSKRISELTENTNIRMNSITNYLQDWMAQASLASENFGRSLALVPLYDLIVDLKGEPGRVFLSTHTFLNQFLLWLGKNYMLGNDIENYAIKLKKQIEAQLIQSNKK